jgi:V-type H+-transporting ATPase subunit D
MCRLKKVQGKKKRDTAAADAARQDAQKAIQDTETADVQPKDTAEGTSTDLLGTKDEDVIF